jgi:cytochrome c-type biogenesis protein CcmH
MLGCHYAQPARERIAKLAAMGMSDQNIIDQFVREQGLKALAVPPAEGFNILAWAMPFIAIGLGLMAIWFWIVRFRKPAAPAPELPPEVLARYKDRIDQDLAKQQD